MKFSTFVEKMNKALQEHPEFSDLTVFATDDQCAHIEISGHIFKESIDDWPDEYCIGEDLDGASEFVRIS